MSIETNNNLSQLREDSEPQDREKDVDYATDKGVYEERCQQIFEAWRADREEDSKSRKRYALGITLFIVFQLLVVYAVIVAYFCAASDSSVGRAAEVVGIVGIILTQSFGIFYLVVKYFFGKRPEDLEKISTFFLQCHPSQFGPGYKPHSKN